MDPKHQPLFDIVESDKLIIFTGAGFSRGFKRRDGSFIPGWIDLLKEIKDHFDHAGIPIKTIAGDTADPLITKFLNEPFPRGENLIEVASLLRRAHPKHFDNLVKKLLSPMVPPDPAILGEYEKKHCAIMKLLPKGIVTVNVDEFHEKYLKKTRFQGFIHDPLNENELKTIQILSNPTDKQFLIKAHGTIGKKIVFDYDAYRDLIEKSPTYNALFVHLFSHYRILFIGFGLSDLDFDLTIETVVRKVGMPLQEHLTLQVVPNNGRTVRSKIGRDINVARMARLEERFGIKTIELKADQITPLLELSTQSPGSRLNLLIDQATSDKIDIRKQAHKDLRLLGTLGKRIAMVQIHKRVMDAIRLCRGIRMNFGQIHELSELTYSLGSLGFRETSDNKQLADMLLDIAENTLECEIVAHALWALLSISGYVKGTRLKKLRASGHINNLLEHPGFKAPKKRCLEYLTALIARFEAEKVA